MDHIIKPVSTYPIGLYYSRIRLIGTNLQELNIPSTVHTKFFSVNQDKLLGTNVSQLSGVDIPIGFA